MSCYTTGNQTWLKVQWLSDLSCVLLYYTLTNLLDNQTLGEEYVGLIQTDSTLRALPSKLVIDFLQLCNSAADCNTPVLFCTQTRFCAITLQVVGPRLFGHAVKRLDTWLRNPEHCPDLRPIAREYALMLTELIHTSSFWVGRLNLVLFYMYGRYYRLSQRMTNIHYVSYIVVLLQNFYTDPQFSLDIDYKSHADRELQSNIQNHRPNGFHPPCTTVTD